ncbi:copia protein, partial [Tanacetum coccineum]
IANQNGNGNVVAARAEGNGNGNNANQIRCYNCKRVGHYARNCTIEDVNVNCILMANLHQASSSGTQTDKSPVYDSDGSSEVHQHENYSNNDIFNMFTQEEQYTNLLVPTTGPLLVQQDDSNVILADSNIDPSGETVEHHPATVEETRAFYESLYNNLVIEVEIVNTVNHKMKEANIDLTAKVVRYKGQEKCFEFNQAKFDELENGYRSLFIKNNVLLKRQMLFT